MPIRTGGGSDVEQMSAWQLILSGDAALFAIVRLSLAVSLSAVALAALAGMPLGALLATSSGDFIVQVAGANGSLDNVSVNPTVYDDTSGIVAVPGAHLTPGQRVVVASS